jgi:hypothetical protein
MQYFVSGNLLFDVLASFPFFYILNQGTAKWFTLLRVAKLGGIWNFFSWENFKIPITFILRPEKWSRKEKVEYEINGDIYFTIIRAFVGLLFVLYFTSAVWVFLCEKEDLIDNNGNFLYNGLLISDNIFVHSVRWPLVQSSYFIMLTLSSVGYGAQYYPYSMQERVICIFLMLGGTVVFARFLNTFLGVFEVMYIAHDDETKLEELTRWLKRLASYKGQALPPTL